MAKRQKLEPSSVRGICVQCNKNPQTMRSKGVYRSICMSCHVNRYPTRVEYYAARSRIKGRLYTLSKKDACECCGFTPTHPCQLDVDHIDGDHNNNEENNLQTLCANCHRLKTYLNRDWEERNL